MLQEQEKDLVREMRQGLLAWYEFVPGSRALLVGKEDSPWANWLHSAGLEVLCAGLEQTGEAAWVAEQEGSFDYLISVADLEIAAEPCRYLACWKHLLSEWGRLLLGMNNRLGARYLCGDREPYTSRSFDGVENYRRVYANASDKFLGRMYSREELRQMLGEAGWESPHFFAVMPGLEDPMLIYAEGEVPGEDLGTRLFPAYHHPDSVFLEEQFLYGTLAREGIFNKLANAWLIECAPTGEGSDVLHVTSSLERGRENGLLTIIHKGGAQGRWVEKRAPYPEGQSRLQALVQNTAALKERGLRVVEVEFFSRAREIAPHHRLRRSPAPLGGGHGQEVPSQSLGGHCADSCRMPFVEAEGGQVRLQRLFREDREQFLRELDHFRDLIMQSSEHEGEDAGDGEGVLLTRGYFDLVPLNSFYLDGEYVFYDQEFAVEHFPANVLLLRLVNLAYDSTAGQACLTLPMQELYRRYGLDRHLLKWQQMESKFLQKLRKEKELRLYHERVRADGNVVNLNRQRMNFSAEEFDRLFLDIFPEDDRPLVLFGSGRWAQKFMALYGESCRVESVIDNNASAWGGKVGGVSIEPPETLRGREPGSFRVLICIKNYLSVLRQLKELGVEDYRIYDGNLAYEPPRSNSSSAQIDEAMEGKKKYKVGYIAGVFDLFHIGHLNMFRRAKEQCEHLIVGVVSDRGVTDIKHVEPFVPFEERIEMVRGCRYVDEAHEIPFGYAGTREAWQKYHFDAQFSGSDYQCNNDWLAEREFLHKHGAELVFFPYTEQTSSTKLKSLIEQKLL